MGHARRRHLFGKRTRTARRVRAGGAVIVAIAMLGLPGITWAEHDQLPPTVCLAEPEPVDEPDPGHHVTQVIVLRAFGPDGIEETDHHGFSVRVVTGDLTAEAGSDYVAVSEVVTFSPGVAEVEVQVTVLGDDRLEGDEEYEVGLRDVRDARTDPACDTTRAEIADDDDHVIVSVEASQGITAVEEGGDAAFDIVLDQPTVRATRVLWSAQPCAGTEGSDVVSSSGVAEIPEGDDRVTITVSTIDDDVDEPIESICFEVHRAHSSASISSERGSASLDLVDNDPAPIVQASAIVVDEGNLADRVHTVRLELLGPTERTFLVAWSAEEIAGLEPGQAASALDETGDGDFSPRSGAVTLSANARAADVHVVVRGDRVEELDEVFAVALSSADADPPSELRQGVVTIRDDDGSGLSVGSAQVPEGDLGRRTVEVEVYRKGDTTVPLTFTYETRDGTAQAADGDYVPTGGQISMAPGERVASIPIEIVGDDRVEGAETFSVVVTRARAVTDAVDVVQPEGVITLLDDDVPLVLDVTGGEVREGDDGVRSLDVTIELSDTPAAPVTFSYETFAPSGDGSAPDARARREPGDAGDYQHVTGSWSIPAGERVTSVSVPVYGDTHDEPHERVHVRLTEAAGAAIGTTRPAFIRNDDATITLWDAVGAEPDVPVVITATLTNPSDREVAATFDVVDGSAVRGTDYTVADDQIGRRVFVVNGDGVQAVDVRIDILDDVLQESAETLFVVASEPSEGAVAADGEAQGTIVDDDVDQGPPADPSGDDPPVTVRISDGHVREGDEGTVAATFTVTREPVVAAPVSFRFSTVEGGVSPASADVDFEHTTGTASIAAGAASTTVQIAVFGDTLEEPDETFLVRLEAVDGALIDDGEGVGTIVDDDASADQPAAGRDPSGEGNSPPSVDAGEDRQVESGRVTTYVAEATDPDGDGLTYRWDLGDGTTASGASVDHAYVRLGTYRVLVAVTDPHGATATDTFEVAVHDSAAVTRLFGDDRIATAVEVSRAHWPAGTGRAAREGSSAPASDAVLARADDFADALAAGPLAAALDAPLLLTPSDHLDAAVRAEIERLGARSVWLSGGTAAISDTVRIELESMGLTVHRLAGEDRFATAGAIARAVGTSTGEVVVALGVHEEASRAWADALSAGALVASPDRLPVLLTMPHRLPDHTRGAARSLGLHRVLLVGGTAAIGDGVQAELEREGYVVRRLAGADRYGTSVAVAQESMDRREGRALPLVVATGRNYPDGLAAAALAARLGGTVLLVPPARLGDAAVIPPFVAGSAERLDEAWAVGGTAAVSDDVLLELQRHMRAG